jgi:hypothetical protein
LTDISVLFAFSSFLNTLCSKATELISPKRYNIIFYI